MTDPRQLNYLNAMGIPVWVSRDSVVEINDLEHLAGVTESEKKSDDEGELPCADSALSIIETLDSTSSATQKDKNQQFNKQTLSNDSSVIAAEKIIKDVVNTHSLDWHTLQDKVSSCQQCGLYNNRTNTVFGKGHQQADWMIIGDAPASQDDQQGQPFIDQAGQLLTNMLRAIGLKRDEVFVTNLLKCRPPNNRDPDIEEAVACNAYLQRQLQLIQPKIVLVLGRTAAQYLLNTKEPLARLRGKTHQLPEIDIPLVVTYHPAYLLKKTIDKRKAWEDLKLAKQQFDSYN